MRLIVKITIPTVPPFYLMILGSVILQVQEDARAGGNSKAFHQRKNNLDVFLG